MVKMSLEDCRLREVPIFGSISERLEHCCSFFPIHAHPKFIYTSKEKSTETRNGHYIFMINQNLKILHTAFF